MADQEVIKHTKSILNIWNGDGNLWHRMKEFITEIVIIVFAVTVSISLHSWSEHRHEQAEVKQFLLGLHEDLSKDIKEMNSDKGAYNLQAKAFQYFASVNFGDSVRRDSLKKHINYAFNVVELVPNNGRFEGFKASGKMGQIENYDLQNDILDLYQEYIPTLLASTQYYVSIKRDLIRYIQTHRKRLSKTRDNLTSVMSDDVVQNFTMSLINTNEIITRYDLCIKKMKAINTLIEEEYGLSDIKE